MEDLARAIRKRNVKERELVRRRIRKRVEEAFEEVERLVRCFRDADPELRRIILFGSLAEERVKNPDFDIDLAYDGSRYMKAVGIALDSEWKVDLVDVSSLRPEFRREVEQRGKVVYDAE